MSEESSKEEKAAPEKKKSTNPLVFVGIGCLVLLVVLGIAGSLFARFLFKRGATALIQGAIEKKTGVKANIQDLEKGKMTLTDEKTGTKVDIGTGKIPDTFPKDFPIYPGAKVVSVMSGSQQGKSNGFWITLSTSDAMDKVDGYYKSQLQTNGWETNATYAAGDTSTIVVKKGTLSGSVAMTRASNANETSIILIVGEDTSK